MLELVYLNEVDSTNIYIKKLANKAPIAVYTDNQTGGYGRFGRVWECKKGEGLALSIIFPGKYDGISVIIGNCIAEYLTSITGQDMRVKWPNDIIFNGKKLVGISCEQIWLSNQTYTVIGVGVNISQTEFGEFIAEKAISLYQITGKKYDIHTLAKGISEHIHTSKNEPLLTAIQKYKQKCLNLGKKVKVTGNGVDSFGFAKDINESGHLIIENEAGELVELSFGEVSVRIMQGSEEVYI